MRSALTRQALQVLLWAKVNKVKINWSKTQFTHSSFHPSDPPMKIENIRLHAQRSLKYLGVSFIANPNFSTLIFELTTAAGDVRRRSSIIQRLHRYNFPRRLMTNFVSAFCYSKMRYLTPLLAAEIHYPQTLHPLELATRACMRVALGGFKTTPIPLLYAGSLQLRLPQLITADASKLIVQSISNQKSLGQDCLNWNGSTDGWSPMGPAMHLLDRVQFEPESLSIKLNIDNRVRDGLLRCHFHHNYTKELAKEMHLNQTLLHPADLSLWIDGSFDYQSKLGSSAAILHDSTTNSNATDSARFQGAGDSYEAELTALHLGLGLLRNRAPRQATIRIYTDSKSLTMHLQAAALRYKHEDNQFKACAHLLTRLTETNSVHVHWIPGHSDVGLNEHADALAARAMANGRWITHQTRASTILTKITQQMQRSSTRITRASIKPSSHMDYPDRLPFKRMRPGQVFSGPIFRMRTGHTRCLNHLKRIGIVEDDNCRLCSQSPETMDHLMLRCPTLLPELGELRTWLGDPQKNSISTLYSGKFT